MALLSNQDIAEILERPAADPRTDEHGLVSLAMPPAELEAFVQMLNRAAIVVREEDSDPAYRINFTIHFIGNGMATLEMNGEQLDDGPGIPRAEVVRG